MKKLIQKNTNGNGSGRVKFRYADDDRYMDIDVEAAPDAVEAVAQGLKSIASALSGRMLANAPARSLSVSKGASAAVAEPPQAEIEFPLMRTVRISAKKSMTSNRMKRFPTARQIVRNGPIASVPRSFWMIST
ncbi:MAG TPA: hypothetical protein VNX88_21985 [Terriglobales bacterium]|nr:hypothetical protein [Terriglobales bacterium]